MEQENSYSEARDLSPNGKKTRGRKKKKIWKTQNKIWIRKRRMQGDTGGSNRKSVKSWPGMKVNRDKDNSDQIYIRKWYELTTI